MIDGILIKMLMFDGNETNLLDNPDDYRSFRRLMIELAKVKYNIRYCTNKNCQCHPETKIRTILDGSEELRKFLKKWDLYLLRDIETLIEYYTPKTVFDEGYVR